VSGSGVKGRLINVLNDKKQPLWNNIAAMILVAAVGLSLFACGRTEGAPSNSSSQGDVSGISQATYTTEYICVKISGISASNLFNPSDAFKITDLRAVAYIDSTIKAGKPSKQEGDPESNNTGRYMIELSNKTGGYSCELHYDTLYNKAYMIKDGSRFDIGTDFARYIDSLFGNKNISFNIDETDAALFKQYGWTLAYQIRERKDKLSDINTLLGFNPNAYYFAYNNELSKDIGLDMSPYADKNIDVKIYRILESLPKEFSPSRDCRGIVVKSGGKIIGAFVSAGRHSAFNACSLKGNSFETVTGKTLDEWLVNKVQADGAEEKLSKSDPEQVIREYLTALEKKDAKSAVYCLSKKMLLEYLTVNMPNDELYNNVMVLPLADADIGAKSAFENLKSAKLLKIEPTGKLDESTETFRVDVNLLYNKMVTNENGEQSWDCRMVYESPQTGWKIESFGQGGY